MTEREQFEAWSSDQMRFPAAIQRDGSGYRLQVTQLYWLAWQARAALAQPVAAEPSIEDLCARIKAADDAAADNDYMLDSDDCIRVLRGTWEGPLAMDKPDPPTPA